MKKFLSIMFLFLTSSIMSLDRLDHKVDRLTKPYLPAMNFVTSLENDHEINDHDIFVFFSNYGLCQKKDIRKLKNTIQAIKRLAKNKKSLPETQAKIGILIEDLQAVVNFIANYAKVYRALATYYEISARYYYIDEQHPGVVNTLIEQSEKLGVSLMKNRGLYLFAKKIDLDLRRITALFMQQNISDDFAIKLNCTKKKLLELQIKIKNSVEFKKQRSKTRRLKFVGVMLIPLLVYVPIFATPGSIVIATSYYFIQYLCMIHP